MPKTIEAKHSLAIRWFHWVNFPVLFTMIWSGLLIYWANDVYTVTLFGHTFFKFFPDWFYVKRELGPVNFEIASRLATGMAWHFFFMWIFAFNGLLYLLFLIFSGEWRNLLPKRGSFGHALHTVLHDLHLRKDPPPGRDYNGAQRITYTLVVVMGLGSLGTGLEMYKPTTFRWIGSIFGGYELSRFFHFWLMILFCLFFLVHVAQVVRAGWNNFRSMVTGYEIVPEASETAQPI